MAFYGLDLYGTETYGYNPLIPFDATPFTLTNVGFGSVLLEWQRPSQGSGEEWNGFKVVRNFVGYPAHDLDGDAVYSYLDTVDFPPIALSYTDTVTPGVFVYYRIFVRKSATEEWVVAGSNFTLTTKDYGYCGRLFELMPEHARITDRQRAYGTTQPAGYEDMGQLERFLCVFGFEFDHIRTEYESLLLLNDPDVAAGNMLPLMAQQWGLPVESELGMQRQRALLQNVAHFYKNKGSKTGVEAFSQSLTGWDVVLSDGVNRLLATDDGTFETNIENWTITGATGAAGNSGPQADSGNGYLTLTADGGDIDVSYSGTDTTLMVPVQSWATTDITLSLQGQSATTAEDFRADIEEYDSAGALLGTISGTPTTVTTSGWTQVSVTGTLNASTVFVRPRLYVLGAVAAEDHYIDSVQIENASSASTYEDPRLAVFTVNPERTNLVENPSFETGTAKWTATNATASTTPIGGVELDGVAGTYLSINDVNRFPGNTANWSGGAWKTKGWTASTGSTVAHNSGTYGSAAFPDLKEVQLQTITDSGASLSVSTGTIGSSEMAPVDDLAGSGTVHFGCYVKPLDSTTSVQAEVFWDISGSANGTPRSCPAGVWTWVSGTAAVPAGRSVARVILRPVSVTNGDRLLYSNPMVCEDGEATEFVPSTRITEDIDVRVRAAADDWTPAAREYLLSKNGSTDFYLDIEGTTGYLRLGWHDGTSGQSETAGDKPAFTDVEAGWVRATLDADNGASGYDVKFYEAADQSSMPSSWAQTGGTKTGGSTTSIRTSASDLLFGIFGDGTSNPFAGRILYAEVRDGIDGPVVASFDYSLHWPNEPIAESPTLNVVSAEGHLIYVNGNAEILPPKGPVDGSGDNLLRLVPTASLTDVVYTSDPIPVSGDTTYVASIYSVGSEAIISHVEIEWYDAISVLISTDVSDGDFYDLTQWLRHSYAATSPLGAVTAKMKVVWESQTVNNADRQFFDAAMFEAGTSERFWFDGSSRGADTLWTGTVHDSTSTLYTKRTVKNSRLTTTLPDYLPHDRGFVLRYAQ